MKNNLIPAMFRASCPILVAVALLALASPAAAQYRPVSDDGIAASPKVRQMLNERKASVATATAPAMDCPKCSDVRTAEVNRQAKGAELLTGAATKIVIRHTCSACTVKWTVAGAGKAKHLVATHKCTANVPNNLVCCVPK